MTQNKLSLRELVENYSGCCEGWKIKLTATSIAEAGVPLRHWEELMQDLMIRVVKFKHRPVDGVSEATALGTRIRSRIIDFLRKEKRREMSLQKYSELSRAEEYTIDVLQLCGEEPKSVLCRAVRAAVAQLEDRQQQICRLFMQGYGKTKVAKILGTSPRCIRREVVSIRGQFVMMGIEEIISWREKTRTAGCELSKV